MTDDVLPIAELRGLLAHLLAGASGGTEEHWRARITVELLPITLYPRSNWRVEATGTAKQREAVAKAAEVVREAHPYVR